MIKLPARILVVVALAGLAYGVFSVSRINSSPAQDVAPPGCSEGGEPGSSEPGAASVSPGSVGANPGSSGGSSGASGGNSGSMPGNSGSAGAGTSGSAGSSDPDGTVSSVVNPNEGAFEWTLERMLLATPMPMTGEERSFLFKHPPLEQLLGWKQADFDQYIADPLGLKHAAEEGVRWRGLSAMLKRQATAGARFFGDKNEAPIFHGSSDFRGAEFENFDFDQFSLGLKKDQIGAFIKMRQWRQEIKIRAALVESMRKKAAQQGKTEEFEKAIDDSGAN